MNNKFRSEIYPLLLIIICIIAAFFFYANLPDRVPSHWNFKGEVNGWSSRPVGAFLMPSIIAFLYVMFLVIPRIDPRRERYQEFQRTYNILRNSILTIMVVLYILTSMAGLGYPIDIALVVPLMIGLLFIGIGNYMGKVKSNWMVGIRTPWTLSSESVWNSTHRLGGKLFVVGGILLALVGFVPIWLRIPLFLAVIALVALVPVIYSYFKYRQERGIKG